MPLHQALRPGRPNWWQVRSNFRFTDSVIVGGEEAEDIRFLRAAEESAERVIMREVRDYGFQNPDNLRGALRTRHPDLPFSSDPLASIIEVTLDVPTHIWFSTSCINTHDPRRPLAAMEGTRLPPAFCEECATCAYSRGLDLQISNRELLAGSDEWVALGKRMKWLWEPGDPHGNIGW